MYTYFVSYSFGGSHNEPSIGGGGMVEIKLNKKIKTFDDIANIAKYIGENNGLKNIVIVNYKRIKPD